jgi:hypothetical protein
MKNKTLLIVLIVLVVILIGWSVLFKRSEVQAPESASVNPAVTSPASTSPSASKESIHGIAPKTDLSTIYLNGGQHATTTILNVGQKVVVTAADPTDAGYVINPIQYNAAFIGLVSHTHSNTGVNGSDTWTFEALKTGTTGVTITASQPTAQNSTVYLFTNVMSVK